MAFCGVCRCLQATRTARNCVGEPRISLAVLGQHTRHINAEKPSRRDFMSATKASNTDGRNHGMENNNEREYSIFPRKQRKNGFFTICRCLSKKDKYFDSGLSRVEHVGVHLYHSGVSPVFELVTRFYRGDIYIEGRPRS